MATTPKAPAPPPESPAAAEPVDAAATTAAVLEGRNRLTRAQIDALHETWRDVVLADDEDAKATTRRIVARLRRATHAELHPDCPRVVVDVPPIRAGDLKVPVLLNGKQYIGRMEMWRCEAQTVLCLVQQAEAVETARLREDGQARPENSYNVDQGLAARARAIQSA
ncbi:MAG TPA: hypothetical protein VLK79_12700 [Gaiellales bacterium]|nr:hypothetical protein [Gaiellales bacterium]